MDTSYSYQGFSVQKLEELCDKEHRQAGPCPPVYPLAEQYSQGRIYREYARFPMELPLYVYSDHGIHLSAELRPDERTQKAYAMFSYSRSRFPMLEQSLAPQPCYRIPHPLVWYRHEHNIEQAKTAKGIHCFPPIPYWENSPFTTLRNFAGSCANFPRQCSRSIFAFL